MDIESAKKYIESTCTMIADDHNLDIDMKWENRISTPEKSQPEIVYTLVVKTPKPNSHFKHIHFHEKQLLHCKSEHETLRISHHMLNLVEGHSS